MSEQPNRIAVTSDKDAPDAPTNESALSQVILIRVDEQQNVNVQSAPPLSAEAILGHLTRLVRKLGG